MKYNSQTKVDHSISNRLPKRKWLFFGAAGSLIFLLYGSLVPFAYQPISLHEAWEAFKALTLRGFEIRSRADLGANFLLMVPAGFFGMGLVWPNSRSLLGASLGILVWVVCLGFSFTSEFGQIFFLSRMPSLSDIAMQSMGSFAGIAIWWLWGPIIWARLFESNKRAGSMNPGEKILWAYLIVLILYNLIPLDVRISPVAIYHKFKAGRIILIPFTFVYDSFAEFVYSSVTDCLIWVPVGFLRVFSGRKRPFHAWLWTVTAVVAVEGVQVFIGSRIFDVTDILMGAIGGGAGVLMRLKMPSYGRRASEVPGGNESRYSATWLGLALACLWCLIVAAVFWYPYEIRIERKFVEAQIERFFQVPLYAYYYSRPLQAISSIFRKVLFFIPLGMFIGMAMRPFSKAGLNSFLAFIALIFCFGAGLGIELGQVIMPNKIPDSTDLFFETMGGVLGFYIMRFVYVRRKSKGPDNPFTFPS